MRPYTIVFKYTKPGEKKPGPVQRYMIYANSTEEARQMAVRYANYPNLELIAVKEHGP